MVTSLLKGSIGRDLGALTRGSGVTAFTTETLFFTNVLEVSIGRDFGGVLKGVKPPRTHKMHLLY